MTEWLPLADASLARGVSSTTIRNATMDGRIRWRWGPARGGYRGRLRVEVWWPDVSACRFMTRGCPGADSGPVTDESFRRFCEVLDSMAPQGQDGTYLRGVFHGSRRSSGG